MEFPKIPDVEELIAECLTGRFPQPGEDDGF